MVLVLVAASDVDGSLGASGTLGRTGFSCCACCWLIYLSLIITTTHDDCDYYLIAADGRR